MRGDACAHSGRAFGPGWVVALAVAAFGPICSTQASLAWKSNKPPRILLVLLQAEFLIYDPPFYTAEKKDMALTDPVGE